MMPHCQHDLQTELFDDLHPAEYAPKLVLPFQRKEEIDIARVAKILGVPAVTARRMAEDRLFVGYKVHKLAPWRITYESVVEYCNRLRIEYGISPRLVAPVAGRRRRDEELLPFPLAETIGIRKVTEVLECKDKTVVHLIEEGKLTGYQIAIGSPFSPWRIHRRSLEHYLEQLRASAASKIAKRI